MLTVKPKPTAKCSATGLTNQNAQCTSKMETPARRTFNAPSLTSAGTRRQAISLNSKRVACKLTLKMMARHLVGSHRMMVLPLLMTTLLMASSARVDLHTTQLKTLRSAHLQLRFDSMAKSLNNHTSVSRLTRARSVK